MIIELEYCVFGVHLVQCMCIEGVSNAMELFITPRSDNGCKRWRIGVINIPYGATLSSADGYLLVLSSRYKCKQILPAKFGRFANIRVLIRKANVYIEHVTKIRLTSCGLYYKSAETSRRQSSIHDICWVMAFQEFKKSSGMIIKSRWTSIGKVSERTCAGLVEPLQSKTPEWRI